MLTAIRQLDWIFGQGSTHHVAIEFTFHDGDITAQRGQTGSRKRLNEYGLGDANKDFRGHSHYLALMIALGQTKAVVYYPFY